MQGRFRLRYFLVVAVCVWTAGFRASAADNRPSIERIAIPPALRPTSEVYWIEPGPRVMARPYVDGTEVEVETESLWRPICGNGMTTMTADDLKSLAQSAHKLRDAAPIVAGLGVAGAPGGRAGLDIIFNNLTTPPLDAMPALADIEAYVESQFDDPITVTIDLSFAVLEPSVLGSTSIVRIANVPWSTARTAIINDMDGNDLIQLALPVETVPVRYDATTSTITNEDLVLFTHALYNATVGAVGGSAATITINASFMWDYSPPDIGVDQFDFETIMIHEIGHVLGFVSRADHSPNSKIEVLDLFRFQRTDGTGDWNPDSLLDLEETARTVDFDNPNDDANTDLILDEYRMSDGNPDQASHFKNQNPGVCLMDPVFSAQETFYPNFFRSCDLAVFDAIGWDRVGLVPPPLPPPYPDDRLKNRYISFDSNPANAGSSVAFLAWIDAIDLASCDGNGARCRLDHGNDDCKACSAAGTPCLSSRECPAGESCIPTGDACVNDRSRSAFGLDARTWWVGEPDANGVAHLVGHANRYVSDAWPAVVHIGDCEIVPRAKYAIRTYDLTDLSETGLSVNTIARPGSNYWADAVGSRSLFCDGDERNELCDPDNNLCPMGQPCEALWSAPNGVTNFNDITAALFAFDGGPDLTLPDIMSVDLHGNNNGNASADPPNYVPSLADVQFIVIAFQGGAYPFADPANCPDVP